MYVRVIERFELQRKKRENLKLNSMCLLIRIIITSFLIIGCSSENKDGQPDVVSRRSCPTEFASQDPPITSLQSFSISKKYRAWQGVTIDDQYIYVITDRDEYFGLKNIISIYSHKGIPVTELRAAYRGTDENGYFMSFGDANIINGRLYITAYNANSGGFPWISRVLVYDPHLLELEEEIDIGSGIAESVTQHDGDYWITYHDRQIIGRFDSSFNFIKNYSLANLEDTYGGYQGAYWDGHYLYAQMHGPNEFGKTPSPGLDRYRFNGKKFEYICTKLPLSYGSGQGIAAYNGSILQNDRPANTIIIKNPEYSF